MQCPSVIAVDRWPRKAAAGTERFPVVYGMVQTVMTLGYAIGFPLLWGYDLPFVAPVMISTSISIHHRQTVR